MADMKALLKDGKVRGTVTVTVESDDADPIIYEFSVDGQGNLAGAYESDYKYNSHDRMSFSILRDASAEGQWKHDYMISVLANLEDTDDSLCRRGFESRTGMPDGSVEVEQKIGVDDAISEAHQEHIDRQTQYQRLGIDGLDPSQMFIRSMRTEPRTDIELFIAKAIRVFSSLQLIISLSQGFRLSDIYRNIADGIDDGGLAFYQYSHDASTDDGNDDTDEPQSSEVSDEFNGIDWSKEIAEQNGVGIPADNPPANPDYGIVADSPDNADGMPAIRTLTHQPDESIDDAGSTAPIQNNDDDGGETADDDDSAYESIITGSDDDDEFDADRSENYDPLPDSIGYDASDDGGGDAYDALNDPPTVKNDAKENGISAASSVRDDVHKYIDEKIRSIDADIAEYEKKIQKAGSERDSIIDESGSLDSLTQSIAEERARLESMEENRRGLEQSIKDSKQRRSDLDDMVKSYTAHKQSMERDRAWLQNLKQS